MSVKNTLMYSCGYQGITLERYIDIVSSAGAGVVVDVRELPLSRKPGFSKSGLQGALERAGIGYRHVKSAGNPAAIRKSGGAPRERLEAYRAYLDDHPECLDEIMTIVHEAAAEGRSVCLTCYEYLPEECHRSIILERLVEREPGLRVIHLPMDLQGE